MAVVEVNEFFERGARSGEQDRRERFRTFLAYTNDPTDDDTVVLASSLIPQIYDEHPNDSGVACSDIECSMHSAGKSMTQWIVRATYTNTNRLLGGAAEIWEWSTGFLQKIARFGYFFAPGVADPNDPNAPPVGAGWSTVKLPYLTSALGRFEHPPEYEEPFRILTVARNMTINQHFLKQSAFSLCLMGYDGQGSVNMDPFIYDGTNWSPGEVRLADLHEAQQSQFVFTVTYTFHLRRGGWYDDLLDEDTHDLAIGGLRNMPQGPNNPGYYKRRPIMDADGKNKVNSPVPLDGNGEQLYLKGNVAFKDLPFKYLRYRKYDPVPYSLIDF